MRSFLTLAVQSFIIEPDSLDIFGTREAQCDKAKPLGNDIRWTPAQIDFLTRTGIDTAGFSLGPNTRAAINDVDQSHRVWTQADNITNNDSLVIPYRFQEGGFKILLFGD